VGTTQNDVISGSPSSDQQEVIPSGPVSSDQTNVVSGTPSVDQTDALTGTPSVDRVDAITGSPSLDQTDAIASTPSGSQTDVVTGTPAGDQSDVLSGAVMSTTQVDVVGGTPNAIATDVATGLLTAVAFKAPCKAAAVSAITLSGEQTIDTIACVVGDRVLVAGNGAANGIYIVATGNWTRAPDFNSSDDISKGTQVRVTDGDLNSGLYEITTDNPITLDTTAFVFERIAFIGSDMAPIHSPHFTGVPTAPTPAAGDNSTTVATTAYVDALLDGQTFNDVTLTGTTAAPTPSAGDNDTSIATTAFVTAAIAALDFSSTLASYVTKALLIGTVLDFAGSTAPTGFLFCYGQNVSRATYSALFAVIGTTFGSGDGSTTFTLPDLRGRVVAGKDDMGGTSANRLTNQSGGLNGDTLGATGGSETHTLTTAQLASHTHTGTTSTVSNDHTHGVTVYIASSGGGDGVFGGISSTSGNTTGISANHTHTFTTNASGSGGAHNNVQPTAILNKIIYAGV
jgi:microcystin-dependent protein